MTGRMATKGAFVSRQWGAPRCGQGVKPKVEACTKCVPSQKGERPSAKEQRPGGCPKSTKVDPFVRPWKPACRNYRATGERELCKARKVVTEEQLWDWGRNSEDAKNWERRGGGTAKKKMQKNGRWPGRGVSMRRCRVRKGKDGAEMGRERDMREGERGESRYRLETVWGVRTPARKGLRCGLELLSKKKKWWPDFTRNQQPPDFQSSKFWYTSGSGRL